MTSKKGNRSSVDYESLIVLIAFCLVVFLIGLYASKSTMYSTSAKQVILANRKIGAIFGAFTMTATWVGGGFINGTAEQIYRKGLLTCQVTFAGSICLSIGGMLFAKKMRSKGYLTMLGPIEERYGETSAILLSCLSCICDVLYSSAIMLALGSTISIVIGMDRFYSICGSALAVVVYTTLGGMNSVAVTDVVQLLFLTFGLLLCIPFAYDGMKNTNDLDLGMNSTALINTTTSSTFLALNEQAVNIVTNTTGDWIGEWPARDEIATYVDVILMISMGGFAVQSYFQRVLSATSSKRALLLSHVGGFGCLAMSILPITVGVIAKNTDWSNTPYGYKVIQEHDYHITLPLVLKYLTPKWISSVGLAAVSAAVMSSADSTFLGLGVITSTHIYTPVRNLFMYTVKGKTYTKASEAEKLIVLRVCIPLAACLVVYTSLQVNSIYDLIILCGDLNYVLLLPQLFMSMYAPRTNSYGSIAAITLGTMIRLLCGEPKLGIPVTLYIGGYNAYTQLPFRTISMLLSCIVLIVVSFLAEKILNRLPKYCDIYKCFHEIDTANTSKMDMEEFKDNKLKCLPETVMVE